MNPMKHSRVLVQFAAVAACAMAQTATAQTIAGGPVTGSVFDTVSHSLRSIVGLPGAAFLAGSAVSTWDLAAPSPDGSKALAIRGTEAYLISNLAQPDSAADLGPVIETADRIAWSDDSGTVAIYSSRSGLLQRITDLAGSPAIQPPAQLNASGTVSAWKLAPDGGSLAWSTATANGGSVYMMSGSSPAARLADFRAPGALAFSADGSLLYVCDGGAGDIFELNAASGAVTGSFPLTAGSPSGASGAARPGVRRRLPPRPSQQPDVADMRVVSGGAALLVARGESMCVYAVAGGNPACSALDVSPASVDAIGSRIFVLNYARGAGSPIWLWDASAGEAFFVPSGKANNAGN